MAKDITVKIVGDARGLTDALDSADSRLGKFGRAAGMVGTSVAALGIAAIVGLEKLGAQFDDAYDSIAVATGATGEALSGLEESFRNTLASGPHAFEDVSTAIGDLNQGLGITGAPLEALSDQFLDLARITDTDVATNIESATEAFAKWGIPADEMSASLDELFRASQASGIGVDTLATQMTRFGAPLQQLGFGFEESAALLAGFEESGINTQQVMSGLTRGLADMARDGEDAPETLRRVTEQIANMSDPTEATALAVELFGTKAGPEMVAAIQSGAFNLEEFLGVIEGGEGTISGTADATDDWREKLKTLQNKVLVKLAPLAEKVFGAFTDALTGVSEWFEANWPQIQELLAVFVGYLKKTFGPVVKDVFDTFKTVAATVAAVWERHGKTIMRVVGEIAGFVSREIGRVVGMVKAIVEAVGAVFQGDWAKAWGKVKEVFVLAWEGIVDRVTTFGPLILEALQTLGPLLLKAGRAGIDALWQGIQSVWDSTILPGLKALPGLAAEGLGNLGSLLLDKGGELLSGLWQGIQAVWDDTVLPWLADVGSAALSAVPSLLESIVTRGKQLLNGLMNGVRDVWDDTIKPWLSKIGTAALLAIPSLLQSIVSRGKQLLNGAMNGIRDVWNNTIKPWLAKLGTAALLAVPSLLESLLSRGKQLLNGVMNGIRTVWNDTLKPWFVGLPVAIANAVGSLFNLGSNIAGGLVRGFASGMASLGSTLWEKFKSAVNTLINGWNNLSFSIGGGSWDPGGIFTPTITIPTLTISTPNIPTFHDGGWVKGRSGSEVLALLQADEYVMSRAELAGRPRGDSPVGNGAALVISGDIHVGTRNDLATARDELEKLAFRARYGSTGRAA